MSYKQQILTTLLDKYEKSQAFITGTSSRRILWHPQKNAIYSNQDPYQKQVFHRSVFSLKEVGVIDYQWEKFEEQNLIKEIWLIVNQEALKIAYQTCQRIPLDQQQQAMITLLTNKMSQVKTAWIYELYSNILEEAQKKGRKWRFEYTQTEITALCEVLKVLDSITETSISRRLLSMQVFSDSKYFEQNCQQLLLSLTKRYVFDWESLDLTENEKLQVLGIHSSPEIIYFTGPIWMTFKNQSKVDWSGFTKGAYIGADSIAEIVGIKGSISKLITIENLTNYYWYIRQQQEPGVLVFYSGGFLTRSQEAFLRKLPLANVKKQVHWGDIDLGGFRILVQIQKILPQIKPYAMDVVTFDKYENARKEISQEYLKKVEQLITQEAFYPYQAVLKRIIATKQILEQESQLW